jgi:hypothetical protein
MRLLAKTAVSAISIACAIVTASPVHAAGDAATAVPPVPAGTAVPMDTALRNALAGIAAVLVADFAGRVASSSSDDFDPGPTLQRAMKKLVESDAVDRLVNSALTQSFGAAGDGADGLPPELRAALAVAAKAAVANVRREISREFANP